VANLCCKSKVFDKLILKQIHYLVSKNSFNKWENKKPYHSGPSLQSIISRAEDDDGYVSSLAWT
jgi:hypothetical protein